MILPINNGGSIMKRVAIYLRVSTSKQDTENQRRELEAVAARSGWHVVRVYEDAGISGAKGATNVLGSMPCSRPSMPESSIWSPRGPWIAWDGR